MYLSALGLSWDTRDLVPWSRIKARPPAWAACTSSAGPPGKCHHHHFFTGFQSAISAGKKINLVCYYIIIIFHSLTFILCHDHYIITIQCYIVITLHVVKILKCGRYICLILVNSVLLLCMNGAVEIMPDHIFACFG